MRERFEESWALWSILAAQATLTLPWMWRTAPYTDEALYLSLGHQGWSYLMSNAASFPGFPVLYPPIAATLDSAGGLIAARFPSLIFMLAATALIYLIGDRLFGRMSAVLGALLFAVCGIAVHLGAAATFEPMALFLLVVALYAAVKMRDGGIRWLLICPLALALANLTKYSTTAWDPVIITTIVLYGWSKGKAQAICLTISVAATAAVLDAGILFLGGANLATAVLANTIDPALQPGPPSSALGVLGHAALMIGLIVLIAIAGVWASVVKKMPAMATAFLILLVLAALVAPIEQARVHEMTSLDENMSFGLPFAALGAGYALGAWRQWLGRQRHWGQVVATTAAVVTVITMLIVGRVERVQFRGPGVEVATSVYQVIGENWVKGTLVLDDSPTATTQYYLPVIPASSWIRLYPSRISWTKTELSQGCFSVVMLEAKNSAQDKPVRDVLKQDHFRKLPTVGTSINRITIWVSQAQGSGNTKQGSQNPSPGQDQGNQGQNAGAC